MAKMEKANAKMHILSHKLAVTLCGVCGRGQWGGLGGTLCKVQTAKTACNKLFKQ